MNKVVFNNCYGGFSISRACAQRMSELGSQEAKELLTGEDSWEVLDSRSPPAWYGSLSYDYPRHCAILIQSVEALGDKASGSCADLSIALIKGDRYIIKEYDGVERVTEPDDINWTIIEEKS